MQQHYLTQRMEVAAHRRDLEREAARQALIAQATTEETVYTLDADAAHLHALAPASRPSLRQAAGNVLRLIVGIWPAAAPAESPSPVKQPSTETGTFPKASC